MKSIISGLGILGIGGGILSIPSIKNRVYLFSGEEERKYNLSSKLSGLFTICLEDILIDQDISKNQCSSLKDLQFYNSSTLDEEKKEGSFYFNDDSDASSNLLTGKIKDKLSGNSSANRAKKKIHEFGINSLNVIEVKKKRRGIDWESKLKEVFWKEGEWEEKTKNLFSLENEKKFIGYKCATTKTGALKIEVWWYELKEGEIKRIFLELRELELSVEKSEYFSGEWKIKWLQEEGEQIIEKDKNAKTLTIKGKTISHDKSKEDLEIGFILRKILSDSQKSSFELIKEGKVKNFNFFL